jgi:uncharacterized protein involved in exopolysaccharide biosynthesis
MKSKEEILMENLEQYPDEINLIDYLKVLYKHRMLVATFIFASMLLTAVWSLMQPSRYEAVATFFPISVREQLGVQAPASITFKRQIDIEDLIVSILESRKMADRIIEQLKLKEVLGNAALGDGKAVLKKVTKINVGRDGIISLSVQTGSPQLSEQIANAYVDNLEYFNSQLDIGAQKQIVQVIDRAVVPESRMPRGTLSKTSLVGFFATIFSIFFCLVLEFFRKTNILKRIAEA